MNLNEGFELDNAGQQVIPANKEPEGKTPDVSIDEMFDNPEAGHIPELSEDFNAIASLENAFVDLRYVMEDIGRSGGMCQAFAMEAERVAPGFINDNTPLGFYTRTPSATKLRYALEEIDKAKVGIIAAISAAMLAIFYKIFKWLSKSKSDGGGTPSGGMTDAEIKDKAENISKTADNLKDAAHEIDKQTANGSKVNDFANDVAKADTDSKVAKLTTNIDGLTYDLIGSNSIVFKKITEIIGNTALYAKVDLLKEVSNYIDRLATYQISDSTADAAKASGEIRRLIAGKSELQDEVVFRMTYEGKELEFGEVYADLRDTVNALKERQGVKIHNFTTALQSFIDSSKRKPIEQFIRIRSITLTLIQELENSVAVYQHKVKSATITDEKGNEMSTAGQKFDGQKELLDLLNAVKKAIVDIAGIITLIDKVLVHDYDKITMMFFGAFKELEANAKKLREELKQSSSVSDAKKLEDIESFLKSFQEHFNPEEIVVGKDNVFSSFLKKFK